ncbi:MAG: carboxylating nicotinate-nucleotide diphosphorylase [Rhodospirillales bacterium]|nr:carboxylating nicotinate-nucleotide diphosphorylase [Rhodospirillales bacterium]
MIDVGPLYPLMYEGIVRRALEEDLGLAGDLTSDAVVPDDAFVRARFVARRPGRVAGLPVALSVFGLLDSGLSMVVDCPDGSDVPQGGTIAVVEGPARPILTGERTALNLLCRLCGIATATRTAADVVAGTRTRIVCTRKTTPGLRALEKYAVRVGGGANHRFGLDDGVMIKDNHIVAAGGIRAAVERARARLGHMVKIEVEVDTLDQLRELVAVGADAVLLDNMPPARLREAVEIVGGRMVTEASGGITLANLGDIAAAGVDIVSLGWLTHSAPILDIGLDLEPIVARPEPALDRLVTA